MKTLTLDSSESIHAADEEPEIKSSSFFRQAKTNMRDVRDREIREEMLFRRVHFHQDVWITRKAEPGEVDVENVPLYNVDGLPPLHRAAAQGNISELDRLLNEGIDINSLLPGQLMFKYPDGPKFYFEGCTPLHIACWHGKSRMIKHLLNLKADISAIDADGYQATYYAIDGESPENSWATLVANGADLHHKSDGDGRTLLQAACWSGITWIVHQLLEDGPDIDEKDLKGFSAIGFAAWFGSWPIFKMMLDYHANLDLRTTDHGWNILHCAAVGCSGKITKFLLDQGFDHSIRDSDGDTALSLACLEGKLAPLTELIDAGADVNSQNDELQAPLHFAAFQGYLEIAKILLSKGADVEIRNAKDSTPLYFACFHGQHEIAKLLITAGALITSSNIFGDTPLHGACLGDSLVIVQQLLAVDTKTMAQQNEEGEWPLHMACRRGCVAIVKCLVEAGADHKCQDNDGFLPLHSACLGGHLDIVQYLLDVDISVLQLKTNFGNTPLHLAACQGNIDLIKLLLMKDASVEDQSADEYLPLHCAAFYGHGEAVQLLLDHCNHKNLDNKNNQGYSPLALACSQNKASVVLLLLSLGADLNSQSSDGDTPLHIALMGNYEAITLILINHGADIASAGYKNESPLLLAVRTGSLDIIKMLISKGADLSSRDVDDWGVMRFAACRDEDTVHATLELLSSLGSEVNEDDREWWINVSDEYKDDESMAEWLKVCRPFFIRSSSI